MLIVASLEALRPVLKARRAAPRVPLKGDAQNYPAPFASVPAMYVILVLGFSIKNLLEDVHAHL